MANSLGTPSPLQPPRNVEYLPTLEAYERWAEIYDTDNNVLLKVDDEELESCLPEFLALLGPTPNVTDLGCGTGRNTVKILDKVHSVLGLELSPKMLEVARQRCQQRMELDNIQLEGGMRFEVFDALANQHLPSSAASADGIISTLVIEHIPVAPFFESVLQFLKPGGYLLMSNMHSDMGALSQAGFVDPVSGNKIRPKSYAHSIEEVLRGAEEVGLSLIGRVMERAVRREDAPALGVRADKWVGVKVWFGMILRRGK